jgi:Semialdehyde dehydrogenase, NAD binding domain
VQVLNGLPKHVKVVDLSADFRLRSTRTYEEWYGGEHKAPELQKEAVYGITELHRHDITNVRAPRSRVQYAPHSQDCSELTVSNVTELQCYGVAARAHAAVCCTRNAVLPADKHGGKWCRAFAARASQLPRSVHRPKAPSICRPADDVCGCVADLHAKARQQLTMSPPCCRRASSRTRGATPRACSCRLCRC